MNKVLCSIVFYINNQRYVPFKIRDVRLFRLWHLIFTFVTMSFFVDSAAAITPFDSYPSLMDTLMGGYYAAADSVCNEIAVAYPGHPAVFYAQSIVLYSRMVDTEDSAGCGRFFALADSCVNLCETWQNEEPENVVHFAYLKGNALSSQGIVHMRGGEKLAGLRKLLAAKREFDAAIDINPRFFDAYLGRGTYRCAVAQNASILGVLPFVPDMEHGMADLQLAADSATWSRWAALNAMAWFALEEKDYSFADSICRIGLLRFPESRAFLWPQLAVHVRQNHWRQADETAQKLLEICLAEPNRNGYEATTLYWRRMVCADSLGKPDAAADFAKAGLIVRRTADVELRRRDKIAAMQKRLEQAGNRER